MAKVAQYDHHGSYVKVVDTYGQNPPSNTCPIIPVFTNEEKPTHDASDAWYIGLHPCINETKDGWLYLEDNRGKQVYIDGIEPHIVVKLGPIPDNYLPTQTLSPEEVNSRNQELRDKKYEVIKTNREIMWNQGVLYKGYMFQSEAIDRDNVKGAFDIIIQARTWVFGPNYGWMSTSNVRVPFNARDLAMLYYTLYVQKLVVYEIGWAERDELNAMEDPIKIATYKPKLLTAEQLVPLIDAYMAQYSPIIDLIVSNIYYPEP